MIAGSKQRKHDQGDHHRQPADPEQRTVSQRLRTIEGASEPHQWLYEGPHRHLDIRRMRRCSKKSEMPDGITSSAMKAAGIEGPAIPETKPMYSLTRLELMVCTPARYIPA